MNKTVNILLASFVVMCTFACSDKGDDTGDTASEDTGQEESVNEETD